MMRILVTGGRHYDDRTEVRRVLNLIHHSVGISCVIHGACHLGGADMLAQYWADDNKVHQYPVPVRSHQDGIWPAAGPRRNSRMLVEAAPIDYGIAFPGDRGTRDMIGKLRAAEIPVWETWHEPVPEIFIKENVT